MCICLPSSCPVCLIAHNEEIHQATLRVKQWFRQQVQTAQRNYEACAWCRCPVHVHKATPRTVDGAPLCHSCEAEYQRSVEAA